MDIVWTVVTKYKDSHESLNCICETEEKAKKERDFLEEKAKEIDDLPEDISHVEIQDWIVL